MHVLEELYLKFLRSFRARLSEERTRMMDFKWNKQILKPVPEQECESTFKAILLRSVFSVPVSSWSGHVVLAGVPSGLQSFWYIFCIALCGRITSRCLCSPLREGRWCYFLSFPLPPLDSPCGVGLVVVCWGQPAGRHMSYSFFTPFPHPFLPLSRKNPLILEQYSGNAQVQAALVHVLDGLVGLSAALLMVPFSLPLCLWLSLLCSRSERLLRWRCAFSPEAPICQT